VEVLGGKGCTDRGRAIAILLDLVKAIVPALDYLIDVELTFLKVDWSTREVAHALLIKRHFKVHPQLCCFYQSLSFLEHICNVS
jgi:hypothetical protein